MEHSISTRGLVVFLGLPHLFSTKRRAIRWHAVLRGLALQVALAVIATYALCGFPNISLIVIQSGGIRGLALSRQHDLARLSEGALTAGALANFGSACIAGVLL
jgi:nucleoside permease NupC